MNRIGMPLLALVAVLSAASCSNPWQTTSDPSGLVTVRLSASSQVLARTLIAVAPTGLNYELWGARNGGLSNKLTTATDLSAVVLSLAPDPWTFTLKAFKGSDEVLEGTTSATLASTPVSLVFTLTPLATGTGGLDVTVNWAGVSGIAFIDALWNGSSLLSGKVAASGTSYQLTKSGITAGVGILSIQFFDGSNTLLATLSDAARIIPNLTSTGPALTLQTSDINTSPATPGSPVLANQPSTDSHASVLVQWADNSTNESGFEVWRDSTKVTTTLPGVTSFVDTAAPRSSSLTYKVVAVNNWGSQASATANKLTRSLVTFEYNGGVTSTTVAETDDSGKVNLLPSTTKLNEHFDRWNTDSGLGTEFVVGTSVVANTTLYASWNVQVSFNSNGGSAVAAQTIREGTKATIPTAPTRTNFAFDNWYTTNAFGTTVDFNTTYNADTILYAKWIPIATVSASVDLPSGSDAMVVLGDVGVGSDVSATVTLAGSTSFSWQLDAGSVGDASATYTAVTTSMTTGTHNLVATFDDNGTPRTVTFQFTLVN